MKINKIYLPILVFSCIAFGILIGNLINFPKRQLSKQNASKVKIEKIIDFINEEYVDKINVDSIVDLTANSILSSLDPHSVYISPAEQNVEAEIMKGDFVGIGINFYMYKDTVAVVKSLEDSPASKAGILAGDRILYADNIKLFGRNLPTDSLYKSLKGEKGSIVKLTVYRKSIGKKLTMNVIRDVVPIKSVEASLMLNPNIGYIKISRFSETTYNEFHISLMNLKKQGLKSLVIDLRDNGGGYLEQAVQIADDLLKKEDLIVFTKNRKGEINKTYATKEGIFEKGKVTILINENTASASEIISGAIQDNDRGTIIGRRSFGKGLVQREMDFEDGSAIRLTTARYYTPSGRSIQKPYTKGQSEKYNKDFETRFESGELYEKDKIKIADSLAFKTKKGRIVYGGGGIVPDIFIPLQVTKGTEHLNYILKSGVLDHFVFEQLDNKRTFFRNRNLNEFTNNNKASYTIVSSFKSYLKNLGLEMDLKDNDTLITRYITAEIARQIFGDKPYYQILLKEDTMIKAAMKP